jgi:hypothetical protein
MARSVSDWVELDLSLRQARTIYATLAVVFFPGAAVGAIWTLSGLITIWGFFSGEPIEVQPLGIALELLVGMILLGVEYVIISQIREAGRRLKVLREHPGKKVGRMSAPFQASLFGPF